MVATPCNALNINQDGIVKFSAAGNFSPVTLTEHNVLIGGASNGITSVSPSTAGFVLTSNGVSADPSFQASGGSGGAMVLLQTQTPSSQSSISFNSTYLTSTYSTYVINVSNLVTSNSGVAFVFQVSTDNGSTYLATGYDMIITLFNSSGSPAGGESTIQGIFAGYATLMGNSGVTSGQLYLRNIGTSANSSCDGTSQCPQSNNSNKPCFNVFGGIFPTGITINNIKLYTTAGTFSGTFSLYGISS